MRLFNKKNFLECGSEFTTKSWNGFDEFILQFSSYSIETAGFADMDAELQIIISGIGVLTFEFKGRSDIKAISRHISQAII